MEKKITPWFKNWFDSKYYHELYQNRDYSEGAQFIERILQHLKPNKNATFLDLACGKGRHSMYLNKKGYYVEGCDLSKNSITEAKKHTNKKLHFFIQDMRELDVTHKYDFILNLFTSFGYFDNENDNYKVLKNIYTALKKNGYLIIDYFNSEHVIKKLTPLEIKYINNTKYVIEKHYDNDFIYKKISINDNGHQYQTTEKVQLLQKKHFINYSKGLNMNVKYVFGDYNLNEFNPSKSERLLLIFQKNT